MWRQHFAFIAFFSFVFRNHSVALLLIFHPLISTASNRFTSFHQFISPQLISSLCRLCHSMRFSFFVEMNFQPRKKLSMKSKQISFCLFFYSKFILQFDYEEKTTKIVRDSNDICACNEFRFIVFVLFRIFCGVRYSKHAIAVSRGMW